MELVGGTFIVLATSCPVKSKVYQALNPCIFSLQISWRENSKVGRVLAETLTPGPVSRIPRPN